MITEKNVTVHELIGLETVVLSAACKAFIGLRGRVVDETKNTLLLEGGKRVPKKGSTFRFSLPSGASAVVEGDEIAFAPENRLKKLARKIGLC